MSATLLATVSQLAMMAANLTKDNCFKGGKMAVAKDFGKRRKERFSVSIRAKLYNMRQEYKQLVLVIISSKNVRVKEMEYHEFKPVNKEPFNLETDEILVPLKLKYNEQTSCYKYKKLQMQVMEMNPFSKTLYPIGEEFSQNMANIVSDQHPFVEFHNDRYSWKNERDKNSYISLTFFSRKDRIAKHWIYYSISDSESVLNSEWVLSFDDPDTAEDQVKKKKKIKLYKQVVQPESALTSRAGRRLMRSKSSLIPSNNDDYTKAIQQAAEELHITT